ncbi:trans-sulfuration enzyme family protein [Vallicoccus soli]|uniref:homocysteine desulfhydrase n=1 Tax=Vallicoccus soli TaxID=2339232 RepID=A0A3A3Z8J7_9ACTN|nr:PLP-dependent aspartate aminotransferase family protein [Vallicoccus soli]RJK98237.1 PLP-dependent transferase [Vallicoccus soli]
MTHRPTPRSLSTTAVTAGRPGRLPDAPLNAPLVPAATYHAGGAMGYGRYANPGWAALEEALGALDGGTAVAFSSGMAAVAAVLEQVPLGGTVVAPARAYSGTLALLQQWQERGRVAVRHVAVDDAAAVAAAVDGADLLWLETPTNPALEVADVPAAAAAARAHGTTVVVDGTFATPVLQRPLEQGADLVVHAATKWLAGHSDALLGAVVTDPARAAALVAHRSATGAVPGALEAFLTLRGLRTLHLRVERSQDNARELARRLAGAPGVQRVRYPGFGGVVAVEVDGAERADRLVAACSLWVHATSLGGVESSLERRRRWPAESPTIPEGLVRLSVGVEDVEDLWADLEQALAAMG